MSNSRPRYYVDEERVNQHYKEWKETGNERALEALYLDFESVVDYYTNKLRREERIRALSYEEITSEAWVIFAECLERYTPDSGTIGGNFFSTLRYRLRDRCIALTPINDFGVSPRDVRLYYAVMRDSYGFACYAETLIKTEQLKMSRLTLHLFQSLHRAISQKTPADIDAEDDYEGKSGVFSAPESEPTIEDAAARILAPLLDSLSPNERTVIDAAFGLGEFSIPSSETELMATLGLSRNAVRQVKNEALERLASLALGEGSTAIEAQLEELKLLRAA